MRFALNTYSGYGNWFALKLLSEGHSVDRFLSEEKYNDLMSGILPPAKMLHLDRRMSRENFKSSLPDYSKYDVSIFDLTGRKEQAHLSSLVTPTIGDGIIHCILEDDRAAGMKMMEEAGIEIPATEEFTDLNDAKTFIKQTGKRYIFKPDGGQDQDTATTYVSKDAEDLLKYIDKISSASHGAKFILQEFVPGIEVSVEGWFNGEDFYALNATLEEKKFMNGNVGPNTGCSGNLVFTLNPQCRLYLQGLAKMKPLLASLGFRGMIDLNTIVTEESAFGLEWTPRFGYDASATLYNMYGGGLGHLIHATATGGIPENNWLAQFGVAVRLTIPPYPTEIKHKNAKDIPVKGISLETPEQMLKTYLYDVYEKNGELLTTGMNGFVAVPIEIGNSIPEAFDKLDARVKEIQIPDMQYRTDLRKTTSQRYLDLQRKGWI